MSRDHESSVIVARESYGPGLGRHTNVLSTNAHDSGLAVCDITNADHDVLGLECFSQRLLQCHINGSKATNSDLLSRNNVDVVLANRHVYDAEEQQQHPSKARISKVGAGGKRRYRRHPKPDGNAPKRPLTAYASFANHVRADPAVAKLTFVQIAKDVGRRWQLLAQDDRNVWEQQATTALVEYKHQMERYKKTEQSRVYQRYMGDFKRQQQVHQCSKGHDVEVDYDLASVVEQDDKLTGAQDVASVASSFTTTSPSISDTDFASSFHFKRSPSITLFDNTWPIDLCSSSNEFFPLATTQSPQDCNKNGDINGNSNSPTQHMFRILMDPDSTMCSAIVDFRDRSRWLISQGTPFEAISGPDFIDVATFFDKTRDVGFRVDGWACCLNRSFLGTDVYVLLACVMFQTHFMRWMIHPTMDLYGDIPDMMQLTEMQKVVAHPYPIDMIPIPPLRDAMIRRVQDWFIPGNTLSVNWPYGLEACLERYHEDGSLRLSAQFMQHVMMYENWSAGIELIEAFPEVNGSIRVI